MAIEEGQQQRPYMASVNIGIGHADYLVIAELAFVEFGIHACAESGYHALYLGVAQYLIQPGLFNIQYLASQRQDGLEMPVPALLSGTACAVALNYEQFAF